MVASKFLHDEGEEDEVYNAEWARSGDLSIAKVNKLEREFLKAIVRFFFTILIMISSFIHSIDFFFQQKWTVFVDNQDFWSKLQNLEEDLAIREARKRGWFSYTELNTLLDSTNLLAFCQTILGVSSVCIATYAAGLMTLLGSVTVASSLPKTIMSFRESSLSSNTLDLQLTSISQKNTEIIEDQITNVLLESLNEKKETCNQTNTHVSTINCNNTVKYNGWDWFIESIAPWLNQVPDWNLNVGHGTKTDFIVQSGLFSKFSKIEKLKESFEHDVTQYIGYFPKYFKSWTVM